MTKRLVTARCAVITFLIGMIAGVAPFLFMQLLPTMLNPTLNIADPNYKAIIITGLLIGAITSIIFTTSFDKREPQDIFFYSLGLPAILIATVSNLSTNFEAGAAREKATALVLQAPVISEEKAETLESVERPDPGMNSFLDSVIGTAQAFERPKSFQIAKLGTIYLIVIGEYQSASEAWTAYDKMAAKKFRSERYTQKNLSVKKLNGSRYVLSYSTTHTDKDAKRIYKILAINDPQFSVKIIKF